MNDLRILGALQDIAKDITEPQPRLIIYNDIVGVPHTFIGLLDEGGNEILRGFDFSVDTIQRNILDDTDGILEFLNDINAKAPRNSRIFYYEILRRGQGMTQGLGNFKTCAVLWALR